MGRASGVQIPRHAHRAMVWRCRPAPGARRPLPGSPGSRAFEARSSGALWSDTLTRLNDEFSSIPATLLVAQWATLGRSPGSWALRRHPGSPACPAPPFPHPGQGGEPLVDWRRRGTAGRTDLLPSTYQKAPCKSEVELLMAIIVDTVSNVAPPLRSVIRSWQ